MTRPEAPDEPARADIADRDALPDIGGVSLRGDSPQQRLASYLGQVRDPYRFRAGRIPVKISFSDGGPTLEDVLLRYFKSIKRQ